MKYDRMSNSENNKRIAKNTILLYFRMFLTMGVGLYTSRIVLNLLGIIDFGIYNIVGGIVLMLSFINYSLSGATSRFITYELGKNEINRIKQIFSAALTIHIVVALIIFVLAETIGLWFLENKLVIPPERINAVRIVYQISILTSIISVTQIPYNAVIIAHERMNVYAYISIIEVLLKLLVAFLLRLEVRDKLVLYSTLIFVVTTMVAFIYRGYCHRNFDECHYKFSLNRDILLPIFSFTAYDMYGNFSWMIGIQGINFLQNMFFGPVVNAASGVATQVQNAISGFSSNFLTAVRPQIVKNFASNNIEIMQKLVFNSSKYSFFLLLFMSLPLILENNFVIQIWLKKVPEYTVIFCQLALIDNLIIAIFRPVGFAIHATGHIKRISFITGSIYLMGLPVSYLLLKNGASPIIPFIVIIIISIIANSYNLFVLKKYIKKFSISLFINKVILNCMLITLLSSILPVLIIYFFPLGWKRFILVGFSSVISVILSISFIDFNKETRIRIINLINQKVKYVMLFPKKK